MTILIADHDRVLAQVLSIRLKKAGYRVVAVFDAMKAIVTALHNPPDAILLDVDMPGGAGMQVLRQLKNSSNTNQVPIIVLTGSVDLDMTAIKSLGADEFLTKPPDFEKLEAVLRNRLAAGPG